MVKNWPRNFEIFRPSNFWKEIKSEMFNWRIKILENFSPKLDWNFLKSLIFGILGIKGVIFFTDCEIHRCEF